MSERAVLVICRESLGVFSTIVRFPAKSHGSNLRIIQKLRQSGFDAITKSWPVGADRYDAGKCCNPEVQGQAVVAVAKIRAGQLGCLRQPVVQRGPVQAQLLGGPLGVTTEIEVGLDGASQILAAVDEP
jgi:hypothetical protein